MTPSLPSSLSRQFARVAVALAAGSAAVAGSYAVVGDDPAFVATTLANATVTLAPAVLVTFAITVLGDLGSRLAYLSGLGLTAAVLGAVAGLARIAARRADRPTAAPLAVGGGVGLASVALSASAASAVGAAVGAALVATVVTFAGGGESTPTAESRRAALAGAAAVGVGVLGVGGRSSLATRASADPEPEEPLPEETATLLEEAASKSLDVDGLEPLVSEDFYTVDINNVDPAPDPSTWSLRIHGAVAEETTVTLDDIESMDHERRFASLRCVGERLNGRKLDTALWTGVPVSTFLESADPQGNYVMLRAADGYYEEFPREALADATLATRMNGRPLPRAHGAPVRALVPGHWGEINVKWITEIEVLDEPATGYWEERGWHGTGPVNTVAKLWTTNHLDDGRVEVAGVGYAGVRGVSRVEVSTDGGETWTDATLSDPLPDDDVWRQWVHRYDPPDGPHEVVVRAVDGDGTVQPREESEAFPSGPSGWVSVTVE